MSAPAFVHPDELRSEAIHRMNTVGRVLANPGHGMHQTVNKIRQTWLGSAAHAEVTHHLGVFTQQMARIPIDAGPTTGSDKPDDIRRSPIGMVAGRPPTDKYPGFASPSADQAPVPAGMTLRADKMPKSSSLSARHNPKSDFTKRVWTTIHEGSHSILGTHDYRTYTQADLPMARGKPTGRPPTDFTLGRKPDGPSYLFADSAKRNADSWAGFVMHASEHIRNQSATKIQSVFRGGAVRQQLKQQQQARQEHAATKIQAAFRGWSARHKAKE